MKRYAYLPFKTTKEDPHILFYDSDDVPIEKVSVSRLTVEGIHDLLASRGVKTKAQLEAEALDEDDGR